MTDHRNRQVVTALALIGAFIAAYLLLYKLGVFGTIACGEGSCETVQNSPWAYFLGVPVAGWGLVGYLGIFLTALLGSQPRFAEERWVAIALLALTGVAVLFSGYLTWLEEFRIHAWCWWCVTSAVIAVLTFGFSLPEIGKIRRGSAA